MADFNKDFFNKVYPDNKTKDLKHFEKDVSQEISSNYTRDTDMLFKYNIYINFIYILLFRIKC